MPKRAYVALVLSTLAVACGASAPPPTQPAPPTAEPPAPPPEAPKPLAPKLSMGEMQKKAITELVAALNAHDAKRLGALYADEVVSAGPDEKGWQEEKGRAAIVEDAEELFKGFPDLKVATIRAIAQGDTLVWEWVATGTQTGSFEGEKATNRPMGFQAANVFWFDDDGLIKRDHEYDDEATLESQIGASKTKGRPVATLPAGDGEWITASGAPKETTNAEALRASFGLTEKGDEKGYAAWLADDVVISDMMEPADLKGKDAARKAFRTFTAAFPDVKAKPSTVVAAGDWVVAEVAYAGTMKGPFGKMRPTKKQGTIHVLEVAKLNDGKVVQVARYGDSEEVAAQFGVQAEPTKAPAAAPQK